MTRRQMGSKAFEDHEMQRFLLDRALLVAQDSGPRTSALKWA